MRPNDVLGASGVVPKVKINYTEIGVNAGVSKDRAEMGCRLAFKDLADNVKKGMTVTLTIPHVGIFRCRNNTAAVQFSEDLVTKAMGRTAKTHVANRLFASSTNKNNLEITDKETKQFRDIVGTQIRKSMFASQSVLQPGQPVVANQD